MFALRRQRECRSQHALGSLSRIHDCFTSGTGNQRVKRVNYMQVGTRGVDATSGFFTGTGI